MSAGAWESEIATTDKVMVEAGKLLDFQVVRFD